MLYYIVKVVTIKQYIQDHFFLYDKIVKIYTYVSSIIAYSDANHFQLTSLEYKNKIKSKYE